MSSRARPIDASGGGVLTLLLPPPMTTTVSRLRAPPASGDRVGAIVFRECDTGELRVQLLRISAEQRIVRTGVIQREVDGCAAAATVTTTAAPTIVPTATAVARASLEPVAVPTVPQADQMSVVTLLLAALAAAAVALSLGLILAKRG